MKVSVVRFGRTLLLAVTISSATSGCMSTYTDSAQSLGAGESTNNGTGGGYVGSSNGCPSEPNIRPEDSMNTNIQYQYKACKTSSPGNVKIIPEANVSKNVCVFPSKSAQTGQVQVFTVNANAQPINRYVYLCQPIGPNGLEFNFSNLPAFNAVYVIDQINLANFTSCLFMGTPAACASGAGFNFGFGNF